MIETTSDRGSNILTGLFNMEHASETSQASEPGNSSPSPSKDLAEIDKIKTLLRSKNDTQMFAGLALLRSVLDNSPDIQTNAEAVYDLWKSIDGKFIHRLVKTGSKPSSKADSKSMLDLGVSVLHAFSLLLPRTALEESKFTNRIPVLVPAALHGSDDITEMLLQLLYTLASTDKGARAIVKVQDLSPLTEIASSNPKALDVLRFAFLNTMGSVDDISAARKQVNETIQSLASSFKGTDAVTFLSFLGSFLRQADSTIIPADPAWLQTALRYIRSLATSRPTPEARAAYTNAAAALLQVYPDEASKYLFSDDKTSEKPFGYLFLNLLLIDIRSSAPMLLEQLNSPEYQTIALRLASAFDIICIFIGHLVRSLEDETLDTMIMPPGSLLKLRKAISETLSVAMEFLRDRWDASVAGAMGLHPDARTGKTETSMGSRHTLGWDSMKNPAEDDPLTLAGIRALALWLREDENDQLRMEATGLMDMLMDLYRQSTNSAAKPNSGGLDYRSPILVGLEGLVGIEEAREILLKHEGWKVLSQDLLDTLQAPSETVRAEDVSRGNDAARILLDIVEQESAGVAEEWMNLITTVAAWSPPTGDPDTQNAQAAAEALELYVAVLQLCCAVLDGASPGLRARYKHSISAIAGITKQLGSSTSSQPLKESIQEVQDTLTSIRT